MRIKRVFLQVVCLGLLLIITAACGASQVATTPTSVLPTSTLVPPTATATVSNHPKNLITAAEKKGQLTIDEEVVYKVSRMEEVQIANVHYKDVMVKGKKLAELTMDVYYPPDFKFETKLPIVVVVNGVRDGLVPFKDTGYAISWAQLSAAAGMAAVTYETRYPEEDIVDLMAYLSQHSDELGMNEGKMVFWTASGDVPFTMETLAGESEYLDNVRGVVVYYPWLGGVSSEDWSLPPETALFVVKAGRDSEDTNKQIDRIVSQFEAANVPVELVEYAEGVHGFDIEQDTDRSRGIIEQTLGFMKRVLFEEQ